MSKHFAVDLGAESGRCIAGFLENGVLKMQEISRFPTQGLTIGDEPYWNIFRFYEEIIKGLKNYVHLFGPDLDSIGVDTWGVDYCLVNKQRHVPDLPKCYRRMHSPHTFEIIEKHFGKQRLYEHTGIQFLVINTLNQIIQEQELSPDCFRDARHFLFIGDTLHYMLGARPVCEYTAASISQLVDTQKQQWDQSICDAFGFPPHLQGEIVFAGDTIGLLSDYLVTETGLSKPPRIITPAVHDTASASVSVPAEDENWAFLSSGTWSLAGLELDAPINTPKSYEMNISNSAGVLGKSLFLKNIMGLWIIQQCKKVWNRTDPGLSYPDIVALAEKAEPFSAFLDPDDDRFFAPDDMVTAIRSYLEATGQDVGICDNIGKTARLVYESLALQYRRVFQKLCQACGQDIQTLHITGGGSNNKMLNQFTANALGIKVVSGPGECSAMGNLLMQAYGFGAVDSLKNIRKVVKNSSELETYLPCETAFWDHAYEKFVRTCD